MHSSDLSKIYGDEIENFDYLYSYVTSFVVDVNKIGFNFYSIPTIKQYKVVRNGKEFYDEYIKIESYKNRIKNSNKNDASTYQFNIYDEIDYLECLIYEHAILNVMLEPDQYSKNEHIYRGGSRVFRMKDGTLTVAYHYGKLCFDTSDAIKNITKMMKNSLIEADKILLDLGNKLEDKKKEWSKFFEKYPEHVV